MSSGHHDCPCRDCFEIAIGEDEEGAPSFCHACTDAGCDGEGECCAEGAYGTEESEETEPDLADKLTIVRTLIATIGANENTGNAIHAPAKGAPKGCQATMLGASFDRPSVQGSLF